MRRFPSAFLRFLRYMFDTTCSRSDVERREELADVVARLAHDFDDRLHHLRLAHDVVHDATAQLTVVGVEVAQHVLHLLLDRDRRDVRRNDLRRAARDLREVTAERHVALDAELLLDAALERALRRRFAVDDEDLRGLRARDLAEPAHDLVGVGMRNRRGS